MESLKPNNQVHGTRLATPPVAGAPCCTSKAPKEEPTVDEVKRSKAKDASAIILTDIGTDEEYKLTFERILSEDERSEAEQEENPKQELIQASTVSTDRY